MDATAPKKEEPDSLALDDSNIQSNAESLQPQGAQQAGQKQPAQVQANPTQSTEPTTTEAKDSQNDTPENQQPATDTGKGQPGIKRIMFRSRLKNIILVVMGIVIIALVILIFTEAKSQLTIDRIPFLEDRVQEDESTEQAYEGPVLTQNETGCRGYSCFLERFSTCEKIAMNLIVREDFTVYYEIMGPEEGLCKVLTRYVNYPEEDYLGKEMTCLYDNSLGFETAKEDRSRCEGELKELLDGNKGGLGGGGGSGGGPGGSGSSEDVGYDPYVTIDVDMEKDNYYVGEPVGHINYNIKSVQQDFDGVLTIKYTRLSYTNFFTQTVYMEIENRLSTIPESNRAFRINETSYYAPLEAFIEPGIYTYSLTVYECSEIMAQLNTTECRTGARYDDLLDVNHLSRISKSITVTEPPD